MKIIEKVSFFNSTRKTGSKVRQCLFGAKIQIMGKLALENFFGVFLLRKNFMRHFLWVSNSVKCLVLKMSSLQFPPFNFCVFSRFAQEQKTKICTRTKTQRFTKKNYSSKEWLTKAIDKKRLLNTLYKWWKVHEFHESSSLINADFPSDLSIFFVTMRYVSLIKT